MSYDDSSNQYCTLSTGFEREKIPVIGNRETIHVGNKLGDHKASVLANKSFPAVEL